MSGAVTDIESALQARLVEANDLSLTAALLPYNGPDYSELVLNRQRWINQERVKPAALSIGRLTFGEGFQNRLGETLDRHKYGLIIGEYFHIDDLRGQYNDQGQSLAMIHLQFGRIAILDAMRRGIINPVVEVPETFGGLFAEGAVAERPHVDSKYRSKAKFRYVTTSLGLLTGFSRDEIAMSQIGNSKNLHPEWAASIDRSTRSVGYEADITMFELHTPHWRPDPDGKVRVFSSIDISEGETAPICPLLLPFLNRGY
jgi:hypothetical protein